MAERERGYLAAARIQVGIGGDAQSVGLLLHGSDDGAFDLAFGPGLDNDHLQPEAVRRGLRLLDVILHKARVVRIHKEGNLGDAGKELMQQLQPLGDKLGSDKGDPRDVPLRTTETGHETRADRVRGGHEHDWDCLRCRHRGTGSDVVERADDRDLAADEVGGHGRQPVKLAFRPAVFDGQVAALCEARLL